MLSPGEDNTDTPEEIALKAIKVQLWFLAEFLQVKEGLSDAQIKMYAHELRDIGPEGLRKAIVALKADETLWPGKFPLPAKIRSYLMGDIGTIVSDGLAQIMACKAPADVFKLPRYEYEVVQGYGIKAVVDRDFDRTATIYAQLRDALRSKYLRKAAEVRLEIDDATEKKKTGLLE